MTWTPGTGYNRCWVLSSKVTVGDSHQLWQQLPNRHNTEQNCLSSSPITVILGCVFTDPRSTYSIVERSKSVALRPSAVMDSLTFIMFIFQLFQLKEDNFGGVSGRDSIWRAILAPWDQSLGMLYCLGILNLAIPDDWFHIERWDLLHTRNVRAAVPSIEVSCRHQWRAFVSQDKLRGRLFFVQAPNNVAHGPSSVPGPQMVRTRARKA
jgi:hypothetical protein